MEKSEVKLNLYQKLHKIQSKINGLGKDKDTKSQYNPNGYKYVTGDKVLREIKPLMNEYGLLLKQEVISIDNERQDYQVKNGQKSEILSKVMMKFTWIDTESGEKDENLFGANGQNDWEKGLGSALTYAERYFLLKFFHIATDEDDIDNPDRRTSEPIPDFYDVPGAKNGEKMTRQQWELMAKINNGDLILAGEVVKTLTNETDALKKYFLNYCTSKGMKYNKEVSSFELIA